jgi:hypothetical protein
VKVNWSNLLDTEVPLSDKVLSEIWERASTRSLQTTRGTLASVLNVLPGFGMVGLSAVGFARFGFPWWTVFVAFLLAAALFLWLSSVTKRWSMIPELRREVRRRGYEICLKCGYWLRGLDERADRFPECGAKREPMPPSA